MGNPIIAKFHEQKIPQIAQSESDLILPGLNILLFPYYNRFFEREVNLGVKILAKVRMDLQDIWMICRGEKKQTNDHRSLVSDLNRGIIPKSWVLYKIPLNCTVNQWIVDFCGRVKQLEDISKSVANGGAGALRSSTIWLGGLFNPE